MRAAVALGIAGLVVCTGALIARDGGTTDAFLSAAFSWGMLIVGAAVVWLLVLAEAGR